MDCADVACDAMLLTQGENSPTLAHFPIAAAAFLVTLGHLAGLKSRETRMNKEVHHTSSVVLFSLRNILLVSFQVSKDSITLTAHLSKSWDDSRIVSKKRETQYTKQE
jgi:hypothetical protein